MSKIFELFIIPTFNAVYVVFEIIFSAAPRANNWFVDVKDDLRVILFSKIWLGFFLGILSLQLVHIRIFGVFGPQGHNFELGQFIVSDFFLNQLSWVAILGFTSYTLIWFLLVRLVNKERETLCYLTNKFKTEFTKR